MTNFFKAVTNDVILPTRATDGSAGYDFYLPDTITIQPNDSTIVNSKITMDIPKGSVAFIFPRSSIGIKKHLKLANTVGVIDADFKDPVQIALYNYGYEPITLEKNDRVAQAVIVPYITDDTAPLNQNRDGGIGSTGR